MAAPFAGSPSGSRDTFRRSPQIERDADVDAWTRFSRIRDLLRAPETSDHRYWLEDWGYVGPDDEEVVHWSTTGVAATMAMLIWDEYYRMYYIGTSTNDMTIRRYYIKPYGGNPVYDWLKNAVRYYIVRTARNQGNPNALLRPRSIPDEYFDERMLVPPGN